MSILYLLRVNDRDGALSDYGLILSSDASDAIPSRVGSGRCECRSQRFLGSFDDADREGSLHDRDKT